MDKVKCTNCGADNLNNSKYCSQCGYELPKAVAEIINKPAEKPARRKSKISLKQMIGIAIGIGVMTSVQQYFFKAPSYDKAMMAVASEINKNCPIMVDAETRLDNTITIPDNTFQYNYTLVNTSKASVDTANMKKFLEPTITNFVKTSPQMKYQRDHKTTINYCYKAKGGEYLFIISVSPDKYE